MTWGHPDDMGHLDDMGGARMMWGHLDDMGDTWMIHVSPVILRPLSSRHSEAKPKNPFSLRCVMLLP